MNRGISRKCVKLPTGSTGGGGEGGTCEEKDLDPIEAWVVVDGCPEKIMILGHVNTDCSVTWTDEAGAVIDQGDILSYEPQFVMACINGGITVDGGTLTLDPDQVLNVNVVNDVTVTPSAAFEAILGEISADIVAAIEAQTDDLTAAIQAICDKLDAGITVFAEQSGEWSVMLDPASIQAMLDGIADALANAEITLSADTIADIVAAFEAAEIPVTITNDPFTVTIDGDVSVDPASFQGVLDGLQDLLDALEAGIDINSIPAIELSTQAIEDLIAALEDLTLDVNIAGTDVPLDVNIVNDPLTVTIDDTVPINVTITNGEDNPVNVTGTVSIDGAVDVNITDPIEIDWSNVPTLDVNATVTNFGDLTDWLDDAVLDVSVNDLPPVTWDADQFSELLDAINNQTRCDYEALQGFCYYDAEGKRIPMVQQFNQICWNNDVAVSEQIVWSQLAEDGLSWGAFTPPEGATVGECKEKVEKCRQWKIAAYMFDNTRTRFTWAGELEFETSTGRVVSAPVAATTGWSAQVDALVAATAASFPHITDIGPRCNFLPNGCGGFPPPPTGAVVNDMFARYIHINACPGQEVPTKVTFVRDTGDRIPLDMEFFEGPTTYGFYCATECEGIQETDPLMFEDGTPVPEADMPACTIPCTAQFDEIAGLTCTYTTDVGCDPEGDTEVQVFRKITSCPGADDYISYHIEVDGALEDYPMQGDFLVDCETGDPVPEPEPDCDKLSSYMVECGEAAAGGFKWEFVFAQDGGTIDEGGVNFMICGDGPFNMPAGSVYTNRSEFFAQWITANTPYTAVQINDIVQITDAPCDAPADAVTFQFGDDDPIPFNLNSKDTVVSTEPAKKALRVKLCDEVALDLTDYETTCSEGGGSSGGTEVCEIATQQFDPDRGSRWDHWRETAPGVYDLSDSATGPGWVQGFTDGTDQQCPGTSDIVLAHIARYDNPPGTPGVQEVAEGWVLFTRSQVLANARIDVGAGPNFGSCDPQVLADALIAQGLDAATANALMTNSDPSGVLDPAVTNYTNGDFNGGSLPIPFGLCITMTPTGDGGDDTAELLKAIRTKDCQIATLIQQNETVIDLLTKISECLCGPCPDDGDEGEAPPDGPVQACSTHKLGAEIESTSAGNAVHTAGSMFDGTGPIANWSGSFEITDSAGGTHTLADGATITGLASGSTQSVTFTGYFDHDFGDGVVRCAVNAKPISANFVVQ